METLNTMEYVKSAPCVIALGCFDGVHKGHVEVIRTAVKKANELGVSACVWSFSEPPKRFYDPSVPLLTSTKDKEDIIASLGVDALFLIDFNEKIASVSAKEFVVEYLIKKMGAIYIVCGHNFTFGHRGSGNIETLTELCLQNDVGLTIVPSIELNGISVSSSYVRELLSSGNTVRAAEYLGRPYSFTHTVIEGQRLGRTLGFPTINQKIEDKYSVLSFGVYLTKVSIDDQTFFGITNIGNRPTVNGDGVVSETNLFSFSGDLYGKKIKLEFLEFIRKERKFSSLEELSTQVQIDISKAKALAQKYQ